MAEEFRGDGVEAEVRRILGSSATRGPRGPVIDASTESDDDVIIVLAAYAGEVLASGDDLAISALSDALSYEVLTAAEAGDVAESVLAMVRTYTLRRKLRRATGPGGAPRRAYDT